jgi:hypothetical protein
MRKITLKSLSLPMSLLAIALSGMTWLIGCEDMQPDANQRESQTVNNQQKVYTENQPAPVFDWSLERHLFVELYEARNKAVTTYTYKQSPYTGHIMWSCPSIGFPIQANAQLTNPQTDTYYTSSSQAHMSMPQAEPNGLYTSPSTSGTFVMCVTKRGKVAPRYEEGEVTVSPVPQHEVNGTMVDVPDAESTIQINPSRGK